MDILKIPYTILNKILERETIETQILDFLNNFEINCKKKKQFCIFLLVFATRLGLQGRDLHEGKRNLACHR